jgi:hypothetical protein
MSVTVRAYVQSRHLLVAKMDGDRVCVLLTITGVHHGSKK